MAQSLTSATLLGDVRGASGAPVYQALVTVHEAGGGLERSASTSRDGTFALPLLPAGSYDLLIEVLGFRPKRLLGVSVAAGASVRVPVILSQDSVDAGPDVEDFAGRLAGGVPAIVDRVFLLPQAPDLRRDVFDFARRASSSSADLAGEGLPPSQGALYWDGLGIAPARHPAYPGTQDWVTIPLIGLSSVDLVTNGVDVEWGDVAGPVLSAHSARGGGTMRARITADMAPTGLVSSKYYDAGALSASSIRSTATLSGPLIRDSAEFLVGVDVQRLKQPHLGLWPTTALATALVDLANASFGTDLSGYTEPGTSSTDATTAFGRFDWRASRNHTVSFRGSFTKSESDVEGLGVWMPALAARVTAKDIAALISVNSVLGPSVWQELRVSFTRSSRVFDAGDVPSTRIVDAGLAFGGDASFDADTRRTSLQLAEAIHVSSGRHQVKFGGVATVPSIEQTFADEAAGAFTFAGSGEMQSRRGLFRQSVGAPPIAKFSTPQFAGFLQDRWVAAPGLEVVAGLRFELLKVPDSEITPNDSLLRTTGVNNTNVPSRLSQLAPRFGLRWDVGGQGVWVVRGGAGWYHAEVDPGLSAELVTGDGTVVGRAGAGVLGAWPGVPDSTAAPLIGPRFTVLGPSFEAPRTTRVSLALSRALGSAALHVAGNYRHTDFLPRRADLNRLATPAGSDQFGRPLYGTLVQQGSLLYAQGNRRFTGFDRIWSINADGFSDYYGVTVALQRDARRGPRFLASYTYSRTTDNWLGARGGPAAAQLNPFPDSLSGQDWVDDRSDFDVPHRVVVGVELKLPGPFSPLVAGLYRYESGIPFTPGFRAGVDANGDGADDNDPAYVDDAVSGMSALIDSWDCLRTQVDQFVARNSCREPGRHRLDVRLTLQPFRVGGTPVQLVIEGLNLIEPDGGVRDHALYLVDRTGTMTTNPTTGVVTVPLLANPAFGDLLARRSSGRFVRLGVRVGT